ncbi:MAG: hypothetical protein E7294_07915 [Lachnospiraceae bacterium]|jgi:hypothetical protein|nr:hypothetical protein [Lachnospiraceae bacterium]
MAQNEKDLIVDGYCFRTEEEADTARVEKERVSILEEKLNYDNIASVALLYEKAVRNHVFVTPVGIVFLAKIQTFLKEHDRPEALICIPVDCAKRPVAEETQDDMEHIVTDEEELLIQKQEAKMERLERELKEQKELVKEKEGRIKMGNYINIALIVVILCLFFITYMGENANVLNYKRVLTDRYASWEQELTQREKVIREKEKELQIEESK